MTRENTLEKIKSWDYRSRNEKDPFIKFICEYLGLVGFLTLLYPKVYSDGQKINLFLKNVQNQHKINQKYKKESIIVAEFLINLNKDKISKHIKYLMNYPLKYIKYDNKLVELKIRDLIDYYNMIKYLQYVRNNLFHEIKLPEDDRDKHIIEIGYDIIVPLIKSFKNYYGIS